MGSGGVILVYVNGNRREISGRHVFDTLLHYLRTVERLTGAKQGCGEGGCGACTVMLSRYDSTRDTIEYLSINACLVPVAALDGCAITTVEAIGNRRGGLNPIQQAMAEYHASQCGFCTPGFVMSAYTLIRARAATRTPVSPRDIHNNLDGNLCRCTGYRPILDAIVSVVANGGGCCKKSVEKGFDACECACAAQTASPDSLCNGKVADDHPELRTVTTEYVFPPELITYIPAKFTVSDNGRIWTQCVTLDDCLQAKTAFPAGRFIVGNSEIGIEKKFKNISTPILISIAKVPALTSITSTDVGVEIGAAVTWTDLAHFIDNGTRKGHPEDNGSAFRWNALRAVRTQLRWFAGRQIRNVATLGGNIVTASPISDINPIWIATNASFVVVHCPSRQQRTVRARDFFVGYRAVDMNADEILLSVHVPWSSSARDFTYAYKVSRRKEDDIAIVSAGIRIELEERTSSKHNNKTWYINGVSIAYGGLAPRTIAAASVEDACRGQAFSEATLRRGLQEISRVFTLPPDVPGGMPQFRTSLALGFLFKAFMETSSKLEISFTPNVLGESVARNLEPLSEAEISSVTGGHDDTLARGTQVYSQAPQEDASRHVGKPLKHTSAELQVTGEAVYLDDMPRFYGELQAALVLSEKAHAVVERVDVSEAERMPGVYRVVQRQHVPGENSIGPTVKDEKCFAADKVTTVGDIIAVVLADTLQGAKEAARRVRVTYKELPAVITIEDAIARGSFAPNVPLHSIKQGDARRVIAEYANRGLAASGEFRIGAQEHFYLEPQGSIVVPEENDEITVYASTQAASKTQSTVARVLGIPMHKVLVKVKRLGGGFGGKETRSLFLSAVTAVAAKATNRPVRLVLDRDVDMQICGTRHAFYAEYEVAFEASGRINALFVKLYLNMGNSQDLSIPVLDRALYHTQNCYDIPNVLFEGRACYTNSPSATAFRGFGGPQGMLVMENVIEHVAHLTGRVAEEVRDINLYGKNGNGCTTPYGMDFNVNPLVECWDAVQNDASLRERRLDVAKFNKGNRLKKRGLSAVPTMYGIGFTFRTFNQAGALVHILHDDGTVLISHGGVEMGQGLHTKILQVAATELGLPMSKVFISETATDKVANASPTAASSSSDLYGMAVKNACNELKGRLEPVRKRAAPNATWEEIVHQAWFDRIDLSAHGFYRTPELQVVSLTDPGAKGRPFFYFTNGAAVSEVEVDILTGEHAVRRTDIVMDVGRPLNPAIDVGQIEGAFAQGLGWCTMEEVVRGADRAHSWVKTGHTLTCGPSTYKIPAMSDAPRDFRVRVLETRNEQNTIHSSKAIGEPPLFLAASVMFAIRNAIAEARSSADHKEWFHLDSPATVERIRMALSDDLAQLGTSDLNTVQLSLSL